MVCVVPEDDTLIAAVRMMTGLLGRSAPPETVIVVRTLNNGRKNVWVKKFSEEPRKIENLGFLWLEPRFLVGALKGLVFHSLDEKNDIPVFLETSQSNGRHSRRLSWVHPGTLEPVEVGGRKVTIEFNII